MENAFFERHLSIPELFAMSLRLLRANWKYILLLAALFMLPMGITQRFIPTRYLDGFLTLAEAGASGLLLNSSESLAALSGMMKFSYLMLGLTIVFTPAANGGLAHIAYHGARRQSVSVSGLLDASLMRLWKYILTMLIFALLFVLTAWLLFLPMIYVAVAYGFVTAAIATTGRWGLGAMQESARVVKGQWFRTLGFLLSLYAMQYLASMAISYLLPLLGADLSIFIAVPLEVLTFVPLSIFPMMQALWFFNRREVMERQNMLPPAPADLPPSDGQDPR